MYAVDPKAWYTQRVFNDVRMPNVWSQRPGRGGSLTGFRQPETLLVGDDYTVHKTAACKEAMAKSNTTLVPLPGGLTPKFSLVTGL